MEEYFKNKKGFLYRFAWEIILTLSNKPSLFSAKRCERFVMFNIAMWTIIGYVKRNWLTMGVGEISAITAILLAGGAFNAVQVRKDQQMNKEANSEELK